jgi:hypothetical protein
MHNSLGGKAMAKKGNSTPFQGQAYLLQGSDQSSTCLNCHAAADTVPTSYHVMTYPTPAAGQPPVEMTPGGDFAWLRKSYSWTNSDGTSDSSLGERHGHNIIASDFGYVADSTLSYAPGGSYPSSNLSCISCHDPHGRYRIVSGGSISVPTIGTSVPPIAGSGSYGNTPTTTQAVGAYRLLAGKNYQPKSLSGSYAFTFDSFIAVAPTVYNRSESSSDVRVAYGNNVSLWCANCHLQAHPTFGGYEHPSDQALDSGPTFTNYNAYVKTGDLTGNQATAYTSLVPFQMDQTTDIPTLMKAITSTAGPSSPDKVMCLSCHRAHASGWDSISRWNNKSTFLTVAGNYPGIDASGNGSYGEYANGRTMAEIQATFYGRPATVYATYQRSLCNKCHAKD